MTTITDNNSGNNNNYNEILFWKVFHNIYLFKIIINSIHDCRDIEYDEVNQIHNRNRIKFKDINSLTWMIKYKQYELLKCKIHANEYIEIKDHAVQTMIRGYAFNQNGIILELLQLLFKYKYIELSDGLLEIAISTKNLQIMKLISTYQLIYPAIVETGVQLSKSTDIVDALINSPNLQTLPTSTKNKTISLAFNNMHIKEEMVQLVLNNHKLYSIPSSSSYSTSSSSSSTTSKSYKRLKTNGGTPRNIGSRNKTSTNNNDTVDEIIKIDLIDIFSLRSIENQDKLIKLGYYKVPENLIDQIEQMDIVNNKKEVHQLLLTNVFVLFPYLHYINRYGETINGLGKEVYYDTSLIGFGETDNGGFVITVSKSYLEYIKTLQFSNDKEYDIFFLRHKDIDICPNKQSKFEFIKCYLSSFNFKDDNCDKKLVSYITGMENKQDFEEALELISNTRLERKLPQTWNGLLLNLKEFVHGYRVVKDKETIDWLSTVNDDWINSQILGGAIHQLHNSPEISFFYNLKFETSELLRYAHGKFKSKLPFSFPFRETKDKLKRYEYPFIQALSNCDIQELESISSKFGKKVEIGQYYLSLLKFKQEITTDQINELIQYLNSNDYINFGEKLFRQLILSISNHKLVNPLLNLNEITEIKFTKFPTLSYIEAGTSLNNNAGSRVIMLSPNIFQLILNAKDEFNLILNHPEHFANFIANFGFTLYQIQKEETENPDSSFPKKFISNYKSKDIIACIESLVNKFNEIHTDGHPFNQEVQINIIQYMINHFFKELIQVDKLSIKTLKYVYSLIKLNENPIYFIDQSLFHSFYYLCIKSPKLEKYLLYNPFLSSVLRVFAPQHQLEYYREHSIYPYEGYDIRDHLDGDVFTFELIFGKCKKNKEDCKEVDEKDCVGKAAEEIEDCGASFDEIVLQLVNHLTHSSCVLQNATINHENLFNNNLFQNILLDYNLEYFLQIKREDLLFKQLEYIQQFENTLNHYQKQLSQTPLNYHFKLNDFMFSGSLIREADRTMDKESFQLLISFNSYSAIIKSLKETNKHSAFYGLLNYKGIINNILIDNGIDGFWKHSSSHIILRDQQLFPEIYDLKTISNLEIIKLFNTAEEPCYNLRFHQLLFKLFPSNIQSLIRIGESDIDKAIDKKKIYFLKFYIENNLIRKRTIIKHLKTSLSNHDDYKYVNINWPPLTK